MIVDFNKKLDLMIPDPKCELNYNRDYELLIAVVLSAQCTDKRINIVTNDLFGKYDIYGLAKASKSDIEKIIRSCGSFTKKSGYIIEIAKSLVSKYNGVVSGIYPISLLAFFAFLLTSNPFTSMLPFVGSINPVIILIVVVFPAPFGPKNPGYFSFFYFEVHIIYSSIITVFFSNIFYFNQKSLLLPSL